jgi:superfamily I DNA/RNA helicase
MIAFDDMVALAIRLLRERPEALEEVRRNIRRVLVDEFQDTSPDQLEFLRLILGGRPSLFLVGDDDQAIYAFRGADPGNIARARELFPGLRILKLETNYRSTPPIVAYANGIFRDKPETLRKTLRAGRPLPPGSAPVPVRTLVHATGAEQGAWMIGEMRRLIREEGLGWKDMAVLYRLNALAPYYRSMLARLAGEEAAGQIVLATVHAAKGLQYPAVFFAGLEDGVLPYRRPGASGTLSPERMAEERRIFYVGVTRAERFLYLCACRSRMARGRLRDQEPSPFLRDGGTAGRDGVQTGLGRLLRSWTRGLRKGEA